MLREETLFGTVDKVADAIKRLQTFQPKDRPYWLAFSGGKDSVVILALAKMAGVNYEAHYSVTSVDPPELVRFIKREYPDVSFDIPHDKNGKPVTMWSLIKGKTMPPTRFARYCCSHLKESNGKGTITITGVRWAESVNRSNNQGMVTFFGNKAERTISEIGANYKTTKRGGLVLNDDNDETRRAVEVCFRTHKTLVNPIIDWEDEDVWEFIHTYNIPYCELYDKGYKRLGCIGCPMESDREQRAELDRYPKYRAEYIRCFDVCIENAKRKGIAYKRRIESGMDMMEWWVGGWRNELHSDMGTLIDEIDEDETY